jgi:DNA-binding beta-propeller fold protein YncE
MNNSKIFPWRLISTSLVVACFSILAVVTPGAVARAAGLPSLTGTMDPLPAPACYKPLPLAINNTTKRVYVMGSDDIFGSVGRVSVIDTQTNQVVGGFTLEQGGDAIVLNENTNTIYISGYTTVNFVPTLFAIDGATNQVIKQVSGQGFLYGAVDPVTGRIFGINASDSSVRVYDGSSLALIATIDLTDGNTSISALKLVLNPTSRKLYVTNSHSTSADAIAVINLDSLGSPSFIHTGSLGNGNLVVDPSLNRFYVAAFMPDGQGSQIPAILVYNSGSDSFLATIPFNVNSGVGDTTANGATVDPVHHRAYFSDDYFQTQGTQVIDTQNNVSLGSFPILFSFACVDSGSGRLFITQSGLLSDGRHLQDANAVGVVDPAAGNFLTTVTTGYRPYRFAFNASTSRLYVADQQANDLLVFNTNDHSLVTRVVVGATGASGGVNDNGSRDIALSVASNRVFVTGSAPPSDPNAGGVNNKVTVIDTTTNTATSSFTVAENAFGYAFIAVDDSRHRLYVWTSPVAGPTLYVYNLDNLALVTSVPATNSGFGLSVNPITGRIYLETVENGGGIQVFDPTNYTPLVFVSTGRGPGEIAYDTQRNKVYVANTAAGSVDNSITVLNATTDAYEATLNNIQVQTSHDITSVAVDPATNTVYGGDDSNGSNSHGYVSVFNGPATYDYVGQVDSSNYPVRLLFNQISHELYAATYNGGSIEVFGTGVPAGPPPPAHGGLSETIFRINGSKNPSGNLADTAIHFSAQQTGTPAGLKVRVQMNTQPDNALNDWVDLPNGSNGYMTLDKVTQQFVLSSTNYPSSGTIYFRALSTAPGYPDSKSNIIGPINLTAGKNHLGSTILYMATNGGGQEMKFRAKIGVDQPGTSLRIQATTSPDNDASWADLNDGNSGGMFSFADRVQFYLDTTKYPTGDAVYFRAVATAPGFLNSISNILGVTNVVNGTPPDVSVFPSTLDQLQPGSGSGTSPNDPLILALGSVKFSVQATSPESKQINAVGLMYDGSTINKSESSAGVSGTLNTDYLTSVPGDHVLKAFARDERGVTGFANPVYLRILPPNGRVFTMVNNSGDWNDPATWQDTNGQNGVPGANDLAVIKDGKQVTVSGQIVALAISLLNGTVTGSGGSLKVSGIFSIAGGSLNNLNLTIDTHGTLAVTSDTDVPVSGSVNNLGTIHILGEGSIIPVSSQSAAQTRADAPNGLFDGIAAFFKNVGDFIFHHPSVKPKPKSPPSGPPNIPAPRGVSAAGFDNAGGRLLTENGAGLVTDNGSGLIGEKGTGLISSGGSTVIGNDGASLITNDGGSIISRDGAGIISRDGAGLITNDGGSLITNDGGSLRVRPNSSSSSNLKAESAGGALTISGGQVDLNHLIVNSSVEVDGGVLLGSGVIYGDLTNNSGYVSPGHSAGNISVIGNFAQADGGTLIVENGGPVGGQSDFVQVSGNATLGGRLDLKTIGDYVPSAADTFSPLSYNAVSGSMTATSNAQVTVNPTGVQVAINPALPGPSSGQPLNIATRLAIQGGDNVLIAGFIVTGPSGSTKKVLIRGIGPSLAKFGVAGTISDPLLELHNPDGSTVVNDNWKEAANAGEIPNGFAPSDDRESAIVATLSPGNYTAILKSAHGETGVVLAEVFDIGPGSAAKLANIATRGFVQTGDNVLIGGFVIGGTEPANVLVRAIAPSLVAFIPNVLAATTLELHDSNGSVISNEGWRNTQEQEIIATGLPPANNNESAILATLVPGNYTAVVRGKNNTTGTAIVEAYNFQ